MVLDHVGDSQIFHHNTLIAFGIGLSRLEMMISTLAIDLQMGLGNSASGFTASLGPFLSPAQLALLASEGLLRGAIKAWVLDRLAFTIGQERLQPHIQTDIRMGTSRGKVFCLWLSLTDDEGVPMPISSQDKIDGLGGSFHQAMHLDFEGFAQFGRNDEMFLILMQRDIFAVLSQLERMPAIGTLEAREAHGLSECFAGQKAFEGFGESIGQGLHGGGWHILPTTSLELGGQVILAWKRALLLILPLDGLKHLVINEARLVQAPHEQMRLVLIHEKAIFVSPHGNILSEPLERVKRELSEASGRRFTPMSEARGTHAALWVDEWEILLRLAAILGGQGAQADVKLVDDMSMAVLVQREVATSGSNVEGRNPGELMTALEPRHGPERMLDFLLRSGPYGDGFGAKKDGLSLALLEALPHGVDLGPLQPRIPEVLHTTSGKIELAPPAIVADVARLRDSSGRMDGKANGKMLLIGRRDLRSNNSWMHNLHVLTKGKERCTLLVHPGDAARLALVDGEMACVTSRAGAVEIPVEVTDAIMPGVVSIPHGWGHNLPGTRMRVASEHAGVNTNILTVEEDVDPLSGNAILNGVAVTVEKARSS